MAGIFISYRRDDKTAAAVARSLYDRLAEHFGQEHIFMDIDTLKAGVDFVEVIEKTVADCGALIAMIGDQWLEVRDEQGNRRLDNSEDWVRLEIATALKSRSGSSSPSIFTWTTPRLEPGSMSVASIDKLNSSRKQPKFSPNSSISMRNSQ